MCFFKRTFPETFARSVLPVFCSYLFAHVSDFLVQNDKRKDKYGYAANEIKKTAGVISSAA